MAAAAIAEDVVGMMAVEAGDKIVEKSDNQLKDVNFAFLAEKLDILKFRESKCTSKTKSKSKSKKHPYLAKAPLKGSWEFTAIYLDLYTHLLRHNVIVRKFSIKTLYLWSRIYTIDPTKTSVSELHKVLDPPVLLPPSLACFEIDIPKLSTFLKNYKYQAKDLGNFIGGRRQTRRRRL